MAFEPKSTVYLCNVPFDSTYKHQIYFISQKERNEYFYSKRVYHFTEYLTVRTTKPDGALRSSIKVEKNIDELYKCNYMYYSNGGRNFFAFITKLIYINPETTEIEFETDVYQTWMFDVEVKPSFVVREHSKTDAIGDNIVPENLKFEDYVYHYIDEDDKVDTIGDWGYLIGVTNPLKDDEIDTRGTFSNLYQGLYFYYYEKLSNIDELTKEFEDDGTNAIQFITAIPKFTINKTVKNNATGEVREGILNAAYLATEQTAYSKEDIYAKVRKDKYKNNKLYTSPFLNVYVTTNSGSTASYNIEEFEGGRVVFMKYGDVSADPSLMLVPRFYKGVNNFVDKSISISNLPQVSSNTDAFKLWLAKNSGKNSTNVATGITQMVLGLVSGIALSSTGIGLVAGATTAVSGASKIVDTINETVKASKEENIITNGNSPTLLTAMGHNRFEIFIRFIKEEYAEMVDSYFTMYGYQTNKVKIPNFSSRPCFNYVETTDINIVGKTGIPSDDMVILKNMFNNGVTLWKPTATVGDYSVDNSPS